MNNNNNNNNNTNNNNNNSDYLLCLEDSYGLLHKVQWASITRLPLDLAGVPSF